MPCTEQLYDGAKSRRISVPILGGFEFVPVPMFHGLAFLRDFGTPAICLCSFLCVKVGIHEITCRCWSTERCSTTPSPLRKCRDILIGWEWLVRSTTSYLYILRYILYMSNSALSLPQAPFLGVNIPWAAAFLCGRPLALCQWTFGILSIQFKRLVAGELTHLISLQWLNIYKWLISTDRTSLQCKLHRFVLSRG